MGSQASAAASVLVALRKIVRHLRVTDRRAEAASGASAAQLFVLSALYAEPARSLGELAERTLTDQSSVSTVVAKLVDKKLVVRKADAHDRRRIVLRLTAAGERVVRAAPRLPQASIVELIRAMPAKRRDELVRSLQSLVDAIGASEVPARMLFDDEPVRGSRLRSRSRARR